MIFVGRLEREKGIIDLLDVVKIVSAKDSNVHLDIFGDGTLKKSAEEFIRVNKLNVTIHGFKPLSYIENYYLNSSLFVMTSLRESFGIVLIEAMNYGIPAIAFDSAAGASEIINGKNGFLIKNRDKQAMADTIIEYLNVLDKSSYTREALKTADFYSNQNISKEWFKLLEDLKSGDR